MNVSEPERAGGGCVLRCSAPLSDCWGNALSFRIESSSQYTWHEGLSAGPPMVRPAAEAPSSLRWSALGVGRVQFEPSLVRSGPRTSCAHLIWGSIYSYMHGSEDPLCGRTMAQPSLSRTHSTCASISVLLAAALHCVSPLAGYAFY